MHRHARGNAQHNLGVLGVKRSGQRNKIAAFAKGSNCWGYVIEIFSKKNKIYVVIKLNFLT